MPATRRAVALFASAASVLAISAQSASAATYCVPNDAAFADCSPGFGRSTMQAATNDAVAAPGPDTVRLSASNTFLPGPIELAGSNDPANKVTIIGAGANTVTGTGFASGNFPAATITVLGAIELSDVVVTRVAGTDPVVELDNTGKGTPILRRAAVNRNGGANGAAIDASGAEGSETEIIDSTIVAGAGNSTPVELHRAKLIDSRVTSTGSAAVLVAASPGDVSRSVIKGPSSFTHVAAYYGSTVTNSTIIQTSDEGVGLRAVATTGGTANVVFRDSTVVSTIPSSWPALAASSNVAWAANMSATGIAAQGFAGLACASTGDNAAASSSVEVADSVAPDTTVKVCVVPVGENAGAETATPGSGRVAANPGFTDFAGQDFTLVAGAAAVDAGSSGPLVPSDGVTDIAGNPRLTDGNGDGEFRRDAGSYERIGPVPPVPGPVVEPTPGPGAAPTPNPGLAVTAPTFTKLSVSAKGKVKAFSRGGTLLPTTRKIKGSVVITIAAKDAKTATVTLAKKKAGKKTFRSLKGSVKLTLAGGETKVRFAGRWRGKKLARGTYRLQVAVAGVAAKRSVTLKVR